MKIKTTMTIFQVNESPARPSCWCFMLFGRPLIYSSGHREGKCPRKLETVEVTSNLFELNYWIEMEVNEVKNPI